MTSTDGRSPDEPRGSVPPHDGSENEPIPVVQIGDVSDEVQAELERLFTGDPSPSEGRHRPPLSIQPPDGADTPAESPADTPAGSSGHEEQGDRDTHEMAFDDGQVTADRTVLSIGDPSGDSLVPLPVDPLLTANDGVVQIIDDHAHPEVRDAADVSRVLIVDDDAPVNRSGDRERRRRRRRRLRQIKWLRVTTFVAAGVVFVAAILASPLFAVRSVTFEGVVYTGDETVSRVQEMLDGASVFTIDTDDARQTLLDDPWVAEVRITTSWRGRATVEVAERTPVVWYVGDDQKARVVDARGHVVAVLDGWPTGYLQVRGTGPSLTAGAVADAAYRAAAQLVLALPAEIAGTVTALELSPGGELSMLLDGGTIVRFGPPEGLQDKLVAVVVLLRRQDPATLAVVDVSTGEPAVQTR